MSYCLLNRGPVVVNSWATVFHRHQSLWILELQTPSIVNSWAAGTFQMNSCTAWAANGVFTMWRHGLGEMDYWQAVLASGEMCWILMSRAVPGWAVLASIELCLWWQCWPTMSSAGLWWAVLAVDEHCWSCIGSVGSSWAVLNSSGLRWVVLVLDK